MILTHPNQTLLLSLSAGLLKLTQPTGTEQADALTNLFCPVIKHNTDELYALALKANTLSVHPNISGWLSQPDGAFSQLYDALGASEVEKGDIANYLITNAGSEILASDLIPPSFSSSVIDLASFEVNFIPPDPDTIV